MAGDESLTDGEQFVLRLHPHWKTLLGPFLLLAVILIAAIVALILLPTAAASAWPETGSASWCSSR